jgi:hypothetical protein
MKTFNEIKNCLKKIISIIKADNRHQCTAIVQSSAKFWQQKALKKQNIRGSNGK